MRTLLTLATAVLLAVGAPAAAMAAPVQATAGVPGSGLFIGLLGGGTQIDQSVEPGFPISRTVRVSNNTDRAREVSVYAGPAWDSFAVIENMGETNALSTWTSVDKPSVHLEPGASTDVVVTIQVPSSAPSVRLLGVIYADSEGARPGVRMSVNVGGNNGPAPDFTINDFTANRQADGTATVTASITNTGTRAMDLTGTLQLRQSIRTIAPAPGQPTIVAAGQSADVLFVIPDSASLENGPWDASVKMRNGYFRHELTKPVTFPSKPTVTPELPAAGSLGSLGSLGLS